MTTMTRAYELMWTADLKHIQAIPTEKPIDLAYEMMWLVDLKHLMGQHDQTRHGYRYGQNTSLSKLRKMRGRHGDEQWSDYKKLARARRAKKKPVEESGGVGKRPKPRPEQITGAFGQDPNSQYKFANRIVDLDDLIVSNTKTGAINTDYSQELQPRDRSRAASQQQIDKMARGLVPEALLWDLHQIDKGSPIIGDDNMVEAGNGRTLALARARDLYPEQWKEYQTKMKAQLEDHGLSEKDLKGIKNPVLVRERLTEVDRGAFAKESNAASVLSMSPLEQAKVDASRIKDASLFGLEVKENQSIDQALRHKNNGGFVREYLGNMPANERAELVRGNGSLNKMGLWRMKAAIFTKVFPGKAGERIADTFLESLDSTTKNFENSISKVLPKLAKAESLISSGQRPKISMMNDVSQALSMLSRIKEDTNISVPEYLKQRTIWKRELSTRQESMLRRFDQIGRKPTLIRDFFNKYADAVINMPPPSQMDIFGGKAGDMTQDQFFAILMSMGLLG